MTRLRWSALLAVLTTLCSLVSIVSPVSPASAATPMCAMAFAADSCTVTSQTATSLTMRYTVKFHYPACPLVIDPFASNACTASVASTWEATGAGTRATHSTDCPWKTGIAVGGNYSPYLGAATTEVTCTQTWSWGASDVPVSLITTVDELNGEASTLSNSQHHFEVVVGGAPPIAGFTATVDNATRGLYHLASTSSGSSGLTYAWFVNSDRVGSDATLDYTFPSAGTYNVDLRVTDRLNQTADAIQDLTVTLNDLTVSIGLTDVDGKAFTGGATSMGKTLRAVVTLSAATATADITSISVAPPLSVDPRTSLSLVSGPTPAVPATIAKGASATYVMTYTVLNPGRATLRVHATGTEAGSVQTASATAVANLGQPLKVTVTWQQSGRALVLHTPGVPDRPDTLKLADADAGEVPQDVQAVVTVTNISSIEQQNISVNGRPVPSFHTAAQALPSVPLTVTDGPAANAPLPPGSGRLAPGATATATYTVHVRDNGVFDLSAQLLSSDVGGTSTNVSSGLGTLTVVPTALLWLQLKRVDNAPVRAGLPVEIRGTLTNRSQTQIVNAAPLEPVATTGNAGGGRLVDDTSPANLALSYLADGVQLPFLGPVKPGQKITLKGVIDTTYVPSTLATLTYEPAGQVVNTDGTTTDLTVSQVGTATGTTPIKITIDARDPDVPPADVQTEIQNFENSVAQGTGAWAEGNFRAALGFLQHPVDSGVAGVGGVAKAILHSPRDVASAASILASVSYYNAVYLALTPQQRANFERSILDDFDASTVKADNAELSKAVHAGFGAFADALAHQDYNKVASLAGSGVATSGGLVVDTLLSDIFFQKLALGVRAAPGASRNFVRGSLTDALVLADEVRNAKLSKTIIKTTDGIKAGQNLLVNHASALINAWGLTPAQITGLINFCKDNQIILAVRSRSKRAADLIRRGLAIGKNEILKLKAVNPIDVEWLGYRQADLNKLTNAEPISRSQLIDELLRRHASPQLKEIVLERWQLRHDEWFSPKVRGVMQAADAKGQIEWGFNGTDNGAPAADRTALRKFQLRTLGHVEMPYGPRKPRIYQQVLVGNKPGRIGALVGVTQDVDIAAILEKTNTISSALKRTKFYEYLSDVIGIEHPETVSWINKGEILFAAKYKELSRLFYGGGEVLAVFGPDGIVRAGFINPALTIYNATTKGGLIIFDGGYNNIYSKAASRIVVNLKNFF